MTTKTERNNAKRELREQARQQREREAARARRKSLFTKLGVVAAVAVVLAGIVALVVMGPVWFSNKNVPDAAGTVEVIDSTGSAVAVPINTESGGITVGDPNAPNHLDYYFDFSCTHCADYHSYLSADYQAAIGDGLASVTYHPLRLVSEYGLPSGASLTAVAQHQPEMFYATMNGLFATPGEQQVTWNYDQYAEAVAGFGVTSDAAIAAVADGDYAWWMNDMTDSAVRSGVPGTPSVYINGELQTTLPASGAELVALLSR